MNKKTFDTIDETIYTKKLANGLNVFLLPKKDVSKVYGLFMTNYGSIDRTFTPINEEEEVTVPDGVAHFLEHKLFEKETYDVLTTFSRQGASPNAFTSFTKTAYLFSTTGQAEKNIETLLDFVQEPYFSEESVEKEKGIIVQELKMYEDQADWRGYMGTIKNMFQNHPVNIDILGTESSINAITKDDLYTCYNTFYHPENMALFVIGNFDLESMSQLIIENQEKKTFTAVPPIEKGTYEEPEHVAVKESTIHLPISMPRVTVGIKETSSILTGEEIVQREFMQTMVLDYFFSESGTYYEQLYNEELIDDSFSFSTNVEESYGFSMLSSQTTEPEKLAQRMKELLLQTKDETISEDDFSIMKKKKIGQTLRAMNSLERIANEYLQYQFIGIDYFKLTDYINQLDVEQVNTFLKDWIKEDRLTVCYVVSP